MRLSKITATGIILLALAFASGTAGALENGTANETPFVNVTATPTETLTATPTITPEPDDDDELDIGIFGPGHLLYRLRIAYENMGETFPYDPDEKLGKQVSNARHRINEYRKALKQNDMAAAEAALAQYEEKMNKINYSMSELSDEDNGYLNAKQMILKHQIILENLSISHPDNKGLKRAYKNSKKLEEKFRSRSERAESKMHDEDAKERSLIKAELTDDGSTVNINLRFLTNSTNETDIVEDALRELKNLRINLSENLKFEHDDDSTDVIGAPSAALTASDEKESNYYKEKLDIRAKVEGKFTDVKVEYKFHLDETSRPGIVDGIDKKLSELSSSDIADGLELKVMENKIFKDNNEIKKPKNIENERKSSAIIEKNGKPEKPERGSEKEAGPKKVHDR